MYNLKNNFSKANRNLSRPRAAIDRNDGTNDSLILEGTVIILL